MHVRSALTAMVYRKGLRLSSAAKQGHSSGEIVNYMAVDVQRVGDYSWYLHDIWMLPMQIILALAIPYKHVGIATVATLIATIISIVATIPLARFQENYQDNLMSAKDKRMRKTSECLRNMRILKLQAWEDRYRLKLEEMRAVEFKWLRIQMKVERGMRVAICGMVGSGKSSFLSCILGEIPKISVEVRVCGSSAYVSQSAWIQSGNTEENILFGSPMDKAKYKSVIYACSLIKDLELFSHGDQTIIGDRGINLSGGQKQRVQLARALYQDADIYLLDDPFSAVDAHTGSELFKEYIMTAFATKTVVYVTHQVEFLPAADLILVIKEGRVIQAGKYDELLQAGTDFDALVTAHHEAIESMDISNQSSEDFDDNHPLEGSILLSKKCESIGSNLESLGKEVQEVASTSDLIPIKEKKKVKRSRKKQLVQEEEREREN
ncbi:hypothetical protein AgCh_004571 [Apium graveolens]